ncbi:glycosyltransferase family 71 protein [Parathielavia appendiculata]|uniref:Glycosyltransferase family 71 protein n=1 Tax=Parathielavia appendiculata TaxID=2587402 RepID=A0AAN6U1E6_9PEZI|nr:glycosyltransferase family 71 protein [Parathielavia appendiculata]
MDENEQESGQLMVGKRRYWYHLQLAAWLKNKQGEYYDKFLLGDKDMFSFAWHALKTDFGLPRKWLTSVGTRNDGFYCGHTFAQHHPDDRRIAFMHGGLTKIAALRVHVDIISDPTDYMPNRPGGLPVAMCTEMRDVKAGNFSELLPDFESEFTELGGYYTL